MSDIPYFSSAFTDTTLILKLEADLVVEDNAKAVEACHAMARGEVLRDDQFPKRIWGDMRSKQMKRLPHLFFANGWWCVSQTAQEVLARHAMGANQFSEVTILQRDRITPVLGRFFAFHFVERKETLDEAASNGLQINPYAKMPVFNLPFVPGEGDVAVTPADNDGADLWVEQRLQRAFLVSWRLGQALEGAGLAKAFQLHSCRLAG